MAPIFRLEKFPAVCRLCLKASDTQPEVMVPLRAIDPVLDGETIGDFITTITFMISDDKQQLLPNMVCLPCLELLRFFAKYRTKIITAHLLMNSLIELKRSNSVPLVDLFHSKSDLVRTVIKDLGLCTVDKYSVEDLVGEFLQYEDGALPAERAVEAEVNNDIPRETNPMEDDNPDPDADECYSTPDELDGPPPAVEAEVEDDVTRETSPTEAESTDSNTDYSIHDELNESTKSFPVLLESDSSDDYPIVKKMKLPVKSKHDVKKKLSVRSKLDAKKLERKALQCSVCNFKSYNRHNLETHENTHLKRQYPCKEEGCTEVFETSQMYYNHCSVAHKAFVCEICGRQYPSSSSLKVHMDRHLKKYEHVCPYCPQKHNTKKDLTNHIACKHTDERKYSCETCGLSFRRKPTLDEHRRTHSDTLNYACKVCDKKFRRQQNLKKHVAVVHDKVRHKCSHCDSTFQTTYTLKDHIEKVHEIQTRFLCDICVQLFDSQDKLDIHRARHDNPNELECPTCLVVFPSGDGLGNHLCITYRDDYECCGRDHRYHYFYNKHMLIKHGVRTNVRVKPVPGQLVGQMRAKRKRFETCPKCEKTFDTRNQKKQHMKICTSSGDDEMSEVVETDDVPSSIDHVESVVTVVNE